MDRSLLQIDMNLLRILYLLLEERNVSRVAARLFISQPAVSKSLQRLRTLMGDPLFVRSQHGLQPTPKAEELAAPLRIIFEQMERYLIPSSFVPALVHGLVNIAAPEHFALEAIPRLIKCVSDKAPNLSIKSLHLMDDYLNMLASGTLDFAITLNQTYPENFIAHLLTSSTQMVWMRQKHPLGKRKKLSLTSIFDYPLITLRTPTVTAQDYRAIEQYLSDAGLNRTVLLDTSHLLIAIDTLVNTDAVMFAPDYLSRLSVYNSEIIKRTINHIPAFGHLRVNLSLVQHTRTINSELHRWIISEMSDEFARTNNR